MVATKAIIQNSNTRTAVKVVGTAAADTITLNLRTAVTLTSISGNLIFTAGNNGTATITTAGGSRATDMPIPVLPGVTTINALQYYLDCTGVTALPASLKKVFSIVGISTNVLTVQELVTAADVAAAGGGTGVAFTGVTAYSSDIGFPGQAIAASPTADLDVIMYSITAGGTANISLARNSSQVLNLAGAQTATGFVFKENNSFPVVVTFNGGPGTCVVQFIKNSGFASVENHVIN